MFVGTLEVLYNNGFIRDSYVQTAARHVPGL